MYNQTIIAPKGDLFEKLIKAPFGYRIKSIVIKSYNNSDEIIIPPNPQRHLITIEPNEKSGNYHINVFLEPID